MSLCAYHLLPLELYYQHEDSLFLRKHPHAEEYTAENVSSAYPVSLLSKNRNAKVIVNFHGNAGHAFFGHRAALYRNLLSHSTPEQPIHVIAFDYRGFGLSEGSPDEQGLITDGLSVLQALTSPPLSIPPENIVLVGQSLGTAVATGVAHAWAFNTSHPANPSFVGADLQSLNLVLMASFTNVPDLLRSYRISGLVPPIFSPLAPYPFARNWLQRRIIDTWNTSARLEDLVRKDWTSGSLQLSILHAKDDWDIPWLEGQDNWFAAMRGADVQFPEYGEEQVDVLKMGEEKGHTLSQWRNGIAKGQDNAETLPKGSKIVRWERALFGGHNGIALQEWSRLAIKRILKMM